MGISSLRDGSKETSLGLSNLFLDGDILKMYLSSPWEVIQFPPEMDEN